MKEIDYWKQFYNKKITNKPSNFAVFCSNIIDGSLIDLGCGNCRDTNYFKGLGILAVGIDNANTEKDVIRVDISAYIKEMESPKYVYSRFLWHSINEELQDEILKWTADYIMIETRTDKDIPLDLFGKHRRNLTNVNELIKKLIDNKFEILFLRQGTGLSKFKKEDPHTLWLIARKSQS
jgi:hypothetical protein